LLTYELTSFNHDLLMNLLVIIARIGRMPIDDIARLGVSQWIRSLLYYEHRQRNALIPKREDLQKRSEGVLSEAVIKDKKYRGGLVVDPKEGIHFDVVVMDFASLYPSIIKVKNLSYETVRCSHEECKKNTIPQTNHWACSKRNGITSIIIGSLRDLRVNYYKNLSKKETLSEEQRQQYTVVSQALKVILNASYGVMGAEIFPLYFLPAAEATTAIGRHTILETIKKCEAIGVEVLYGDTDSIFIKKPSEQQIQTVIEQAKADHGVDLEIDKVYRYCVLSNRKKNYLGVTKDGKVDVKGLTGKKSHTPAFIKKLFYELLDILSQVQTMDDFERAKKQISEKIANCAKKVEEKEIPLEDLTFNVMLSKSPSEYVKTIPQHIRAAKQLESIREIKKGDKISFVKILNKPGVRPIELAKKEEIDSKKYMEFMEATLDQITSSMDMDFDIILGKPKQTGLDEFFWS
jgi:DNA polymerase I